MDEVSKKGEKIMKHHKILWSSHSIKLFFTLAFITTFLSMTVTTFAFQTKAIQGSVWIANEEGNSLTVVNAGTNKNVVVL